jgi:ABC-2 type transport system ATP-binding protein
MTKGAYMIEISNLTKYYGDLCALDNVSFSIKKGEILGLLGPNGAGKTTALRLLTGYLSPTSGNVTAKGISVKDNPLAIKEMIGYLPESAPLYQDLLVYDYLGYVADIRGFEGEDKDARIRELSDICGLREVMHRSIEEISKGYKQRVGLAHAMMSDPEILVLDEPTTGLDPNQIAEIRNIIKQIGKEKTVILSTHILSEVEASCNRVVIIHKGRIVADSSTEELKRSSQSDYSVDISLMGVGSEDVESRLLSVEGVSEIQSTGADNGAMNFHIMCKTDHDIRKDIYNEIKKTDWILLELKRESKSLEKVFRELTKEN